MLDNEMIVREKISNHSALIGIIGLGYVGLPLALAFAERGYRVLGLDVDEAKTAKIQRGECYIRHLEERRLQEVVAGGLFEATTDFSRLGEPDVSLICVPTPLTPQRQPDMRYVCSSAERIAETLRPGQLIILESTTYPGTTDELVRSILQDGGKRGHGKAEMVCGRDFFLAFSPEREDPGNPDYGTTNTPKVVGGVDPISGDLAELLYGEVVERVVRVSSARAAEAAKLSENIFRAVNIALVNELKLVYDRMGIDIWEVLDAASTKPFGFMRFNPGPGWGGHCIPLDPFYLAWKAREYGQATRFIELAGEVNIEMPRYVIHKLDLALNRKRKSVMGSKVLLLGLAYKKDIDDPRESPTFEIIEQLLELGAEVSYHDPHIAEAPTMRTWPDLPAMHSQPLTPATVSEADAVVIVTDHSTVDYRLVLEHAQLIVDTRGVFREPHAKVVKA